MASQGSSAGAGRAALQLPSAQPGAAAANPTASQQQQGHQRGPSNIANSMTGPANIGNVAATANNAQINQRANPPPSPPSRRWAAAFRIAKNVILGALTLAGVIVAIYYGWATLSYAKWQAAHDFRDGCESDQVSRRNISLISCQALNIVGAQSITIISMRGRAAHWYKASADQAQAARPKRCRRSGRYTVERNFNNASHAVPHAWNAE